MELFYSLATPFLELINLFVYLVTWAYQICHSFGFILFWTIRSTVNLVLNTIYSLGSALQVLVEDFELFLRDIFLLGADICDLLISLGENLVTSVSEGISALTGFISTSLTINLDIMQGVEKLEKPVVLLRDALLLIGYCVWELVNCLVSLLMYVNKAPYIAALLITKWFDNFLYKIQFIPYEAICGLLILILAAYLGQKRNPNLIPNLKELSREFLRKSKLVILFVIMKTGLFLLIGVDKAIKLVQMTFSGLKNVLGLTYQSVVSKTPTKAALRIQLEKEKAQRLCVVCLDNTRNTMLLDCRHLCMCRRCAVIVGTESGECPVCRALITQIITVYT